MDWPHNRHRRRASPERHQALLTVCNDDAAQGDLPKDPGVLRTAAQFNQTNIGVYASVLRGGTIRRDDSVKID